MSFRIGRIGLRGILQKEFSAISRRGMNRFLYRIGAGTYQGWRRIPYGARLGLIGAGLGTYAGIKGVRSYIGGWRAGVAGPEDMYNTAHGYGTGPNSLGNSSYFRNQGRIPSNHLAHSGLGLNLYRLRHG